MKYCILILSLCIVLRASEGVKLEENFYILNAHNQERISFEALIVELLKADIILLGEKHDEPKHKLTQLMIFQALEGNFSSTGIEFDIALEMIASKQQDILDRAFKNKNQIAKEDLYGALNWDKSWIWKDYRDFVEAVFYSRARILGANLSRSEILDIYNNDYHLSGSSSTEDGVKRQIFDIIALAHELNPKEHEQLLNKLVQIQQAKDRRMADVLVHHPNKILLLAGSYHVSKQIGIPLHIQDLKSHKKTVVIDLNYGKVQTKASDYIFVYEDM